MPVPLTVGRYRPDTVNSILGKGIAFPITKSQTGGIALSEGEENIRTSILELLSTFVGEGIRSFFVKDGVIYGVRLRLYLFEKTNDVADLIKYEIKRAISVWEPRVVVDYVDCITPVDSTADGRKRVNATVGYTVVATGLRDSVKI